MTPDILTAVFGWMTLLNIVLYAVSALLVFSLRNWMVTIQARLFGMEPADIRRIVYAWLGAYKLMILVFCLTPWIALRLVT